MLRVYDAFMLEGSKTLFRVGLALLKINEEALLATRNEEEAHTLLKEIPSLCFDSERLLKVAFKDLGSSLFNSSISGKLKLFREKQLKHYLESSKAADFRFLDGKTKCTRLTLLCCMCRISIRVECRVPGVCVLACLSRR